MTKNQIEYWQLQRMKKADAETARTNRARELLSAQQQSETARSNKENERLQSVKLFNDYTLGQSKLTNERMGLMETRRSNIARETEQRRSNMANEANVAARNTISRYELSEKSRSNMAQENISRGGLLNNMLGTSNQRSSISNQLYLGTLANRLQRQQLQTQRYGMNLNYNAQQERNQIARLQANTAQRSTMLNYEINKSRNDLTYQSLIEQQRHNQTTEYINAFGTALNAGLKLGGRR